LYSYIAFISIIFNLGLLFGGIFGDPGVKDSIYLKYSKDKHGKLDIEENISLDDGDDIEL
jgi:hypothetical protein